MAVSPQRQKRETAMQVETVRHTFDRAVNSQGRSVSHILAGVALTGGAVLASALISARNAPTDANPEVKAEYDMLRKPAFQPPKQAFAVIWPPLFLALTISGLRIWNAPPSRARTEAITLWSAVQALNALWMALGPRRLSAQLAAAVASLGASAAYVWRARAVDPPASALVAPYLGWISFANALTGELWRKNTPRPTIH
jgi:benzodiazapine receptor